jgi:hypothetical protein
VAGVTTIIFVARIQNGLYQNVRLSKSLPETLRNEISPGEYNRLVILLIEKAVVWQDRLELELKTSRIKSLIE